MLREYYKAAREQAAVLKKDLYGMVKLTGTEAVPWLQGMVTNDVAKLASGQGCYAAHLNPQGKIVAHMVIHRNDNALWLVLERSAISKLVSAFDKLLIMEDVQVRDVSEEIRIVGLIGPQSKQVIETWLDQPVGLDPMYSHRESGAYRIAVTDLGYDIWAPSDRVDTLLNELSSVGAVVIDEETWNVLRTEAGLPLYGVDIDETTTMPELGERGISYDKGCYVGQEVVAKVKYIGHVNRRFAKLEIEGEIVPEVKSSVRKTDKEVGYITTSVFSPALTKPIALGFVSRAAYAPGTTVEIIDRGQVLNARIA